MSFGFFSLGIQELIILGFLVGMPMIIVAIILVINQSSQRSASRMAQLEEENDRLREELDRNR